MMSDNDVKEKVSLLILRITFTVSVIRSTVDEIDDHVEKEMVKKEVDDNDAKIVSCKPVKGIGAWKYVVDIDAKKAPFFSDRLARIGEQGARIKEVEEFYR